MSSRKIIIIGKKAYRLRIEDSNRIETCADENQLKEILLSIEKDYKPVLSVTEIFTL